MELKRQPEEKNPMMLATRKSLFQLLSFLDNKLPEYCAVNIGSYFRQYLVWHWLIRGVHLLDSFLCGRHTVD